MKKFYTDGENICYYQVNELLFIFLFDYELDTHIETEEEIIYKYKNV